MYFTDTPELRKFEREMRQLSLIHISNQMKQAGLNSKVSITKDFFQNSLFNFQGPARDIRGYRSAGRAPALQAGGQRFDPAYLHQ